jgi:hypothetical protein
MLAGNFVTSKPPSRRGCKVTTGMVDMPLGSPFRVGKGQVSLVVKTEVGEYWLMDLIC